MFEYLLELPQTRAEFDFETLELAMYSKGAQVGVPSDGGLQEHPTELCVCLGLVLCVFASVCPLYLLARR